MTFIINNEPWEVLYVHPLDSVLLRPNGERTVGACDDYYKTIYLSSALQGNFLKKVLCHEITHAAMFAYDVILTEEQEELIAELIATFGEEIINITNVIFDYLRRGR